MIENKFVRQRPDFKFCGQTLFGNTDLLYTMQNNQDMTATQREFMQTLIERIWEEEK